MAGAEDQTSLEAAIERGLGKTDNFQDEAGLLMLPVPRRIVMVLCRHVTRPNGRAYWRAWSDQLRRWNFRK